MAGVCRICVVEVEGQRTLQPACTFPVVNQMKINTHSRKVRLARRHVLELLLSEHYGECYSCVRNGNCELQSLAEEYGITEFAFGHPDEPVAEPDLSSYSVMRDMNKCIRCRRCVRTCIDLQEVGVLEAVGRSNTTTIETFEELPLLEAVCINCGQCVNRCPTGALYAKDETDDVWAAIDDPDKHVVIQTAPAPRAAMGELFGLEPGTPVTFEMNTGLRRVGFDRVFDTNFTADLTIIEEGTELILRLYKALVGRGPEVALPQFTSCSPGWVKYLEHFYPEYLPNASSAKSPQQMFGALIKTYYAEQARRRPREDRQRRADALLGEEVRVQPARDARLRLQGRRLRAHHARARQDVQGGGHPPAGPGEVRLRRPVRHRPRARASSSARPAASWRPPCAPCSRWSPARRSRASTTTATSCRCAASRACKYAEITVPKVGPVPEIVAHLVPDWEWLERRDAQGRRGARHRQRQEGHGRHQGGRQVQRVPLHRVHGLPRRLPGRRRPADPDERRHPRGAGPGDLQRGQAYAVRKSHENPAVLQTYAEFLTEGPCGHKSHELLHTSYVARGKRLPQKTH